MNNNIEILNKFKKLEEHIGSDVDNLQYQHVLIRSIYNNVMVNILQQNFEPLIIEINNITNNREFNELYNSYIDNIINSIRLFGENNYIECLQQLNYSLQKIEFIFRYLHYPRGRYLQHLDDIIEE